MDNLDSQYITLEYPADYIARITLNRPEARNAQSVQLLYELNDAFNLAAHDVDVKVIVLASTGKDFSAGHDLREDNPLETLNNYRTTSTWAGYSEPGVEGHVGFEQEVYLGFSERWRNIPKPTIAQVQGRCIAGGLMLVWPCDLIIASDDAEFTDVTVNMGISGAEYFAHPWEMGTRKAKEHLFAAEPMSADEAYRVGMVNKVVPREQLESTTLAMAVKIAKKPMFGLKMTKEAINAAEDARGRRQGMLTAFYLHQLSHAHNRLIHGTPIDPTFFAENFNRD